MFDAFDFRRREKMVARIWSVVRSVLRRPKIMVRIVSVERGWDAICMVCVWYGVIWGGTMGWLLL